MSTILNVYSTNAFKRFLLPAINDSTYSILLSKGIFQMDRNIELKLELILPTPKSEINAVKSIL